jgi:DNA polymerase-1
MLKNIPVCQIYVSDCEGDDIVAFLCRITFREKNKVVVSSDKDMYQLLDDKTKIYSLHKKRFYTSEELLEEFKISSQNFAIAKSLCGDVSDNIPGIKGIGFKTAASKLPFLGSDSSILLQDVIAYAYSHMDESPVYKRIVESQDDIRRNWKLVYLDGSMLSANQIVKVENVLSTFEPRVNKMGLIKHLIKEGINDFDVESFYYDMSCIEGLKYASENK